ncbi:hypothetical protein [Saccharothrix lopnurensis]|uniref:DUF2384 domain-containing protein n=1 Tax=Saccharothrix lopnurensis TaxID=1670621 RepID=A0ABW1P558_9PSEU
MTQRRPRHGQGSGLGLSTAGELLAMLCRAEAASARLDPDQFGDLVHARGELWRSTAGDHERVSADRRRAVLAYPDLARRLRLLLDLPDAKRWTGYMPPAVDQNGRPNDSPIRAALVKLVHEAYTREHAGEAASA